jgi:hypothetical protein
VPARLGRACSDVPHPPQHHLPQAEGLGEVIVTASGECGDPIVDAVAGGQEQHQ